MENSYKYFKNESCQYFPCHQGMPEEMFNCLFCFCPMNPYKDCLGTPDYIRRGDGTVIKDCSGCTFPHKPENYRKIMEFLKSRSFTDS
ncbi:MAG: metal-binding protein [Lachnospiraceae bacterium]|nr:metal-binding protein [Lachnospiraceae bacterium]